MDLRILSWIDVFIFVWLFDCIKLKSRVRNYRTDTDFYSYYYPNQFLLYIYIVLVFEWVIGFGSSQNFIGLKKRLIFHLPILFFFFSSCRFRVYSDMSWIKIGNGLETYRTKWVAILITHTIFMWVQANYWN